MYKTTSSLCLFLGVFCASAACCNPASRSELAVSFSTLRSDFELIMADPDQSRTINIEYTEEAVVSVLFAPNPFRLNLRWPRKYIQIYGKVNIQHNDGSMEEKEHVAFMGGLFFSSSPGQPLSELPSEQEKTTYMIITPNSQDEPRRAVKTICYISTSQMTTLLNLKKKDMKKNKIGERDKIKADISLGLSVTPLTYDIENKILHLRKPLKGISLSKNEIQPDIFFDVWYRPRNNRYGSSSRLFEGFDAVRIYYEWYRLQGEATLPEATLVEEGEEIRKQMFEIDIRSAYGRLHIDGLKYTNIFLIYGSNIVLEVRAEDDGHKKYLEIIGTTIADAKGIGPYNVHGYYDLNELKFTDQLKDNSQFIPSTFRQRSYYLMYTPTLKLERHLKAIWAAMQGGCDTNEEIYHFSIFYGESIKVKYYCDRNDIAMEDGQKFTMQSISASGKTILNECNTLWYTNSQRMDIQCTDNDATSIAIRQKPRQLWLNNGRPKMIKTELLIAEMKLLKDMLIKNGKSRSIKPTKGVSTLDGDMLFTMVLPYGDNNPIYVEVHAQFQVRSNDRDVPHNQLNFNGKKFFAVGDTSKLTLNEILLSSRYDSDDFPESMFIIGSAYLTTKQLQETLKIACESASKRCRARKNKSYLIKIVHLHQFVLDGSYDCSEQVFLFKGNFNALLLSKTDQNVEILTERPITNFIYVVRDKFFIPGTESFDDVYAIRLPKMAADFKETLKSFGSPERIKLRRTYFIFKSKE